MAARQDDEEQLDPGPAGTPPAADGSPVDRAAAEGPVPPADDWEQAWLPGWLTGPEADAGEAPADVPEGGDREDGGR